jgi:putative two-component system response regulator
MLLPSRILVVDDNPDNVLLLETLLSHAGYTDVAATTNPFEALDLFEQHRPDIILLDLHMPGLNGFSLIGDLRNRIGGTGIPIIVLTGDTSREARERALKAGASDFLTKPFDQIEIVLRVRNLLELRQLHATLERRNRSLDAEVRRRTRQLEEARVETLERLAIAAEYRDDETGQHARRVGQLSAAIALRVDLPSPRVEVIARAAPLHDLGKIGIPDHILLKPGPLTPDEWEIMKTHTSIGAGVLSASTSRILQVAETIAGTHHEKWDGTGYLGLVGEQTPLEGRIVSLADAFDAMTSDRPYRPARSHEDAFDEIRAEAGKQFDPELVDAFSGVQKEPLVELTANRIN